MNTLTATQSRAMAALTAATSSGLTRRRGGYGASIGAEVFTVRTVRALERAGLVVMDSHAARLTQAGRNAAKNAAGFDVLSSA